MKFELWLIPLFLIASLLHGIAGMGFPLITIGALSGVYGLTNAVVLVLVPTAVLNLMAWVGGTGGVWHNTTFYLKKYLPLVIVSILGSALGAYLLLVVNASYLMLALSLVVLWYATSSLLGKKITLPDTTLSLVVIGFIAGVVGGATNAMSSVLLMYLLSMTDDKTVIIKVGNLCYFVNKIVQAIVLKEVLLQVPTQTWTMIIGLTVLSVLGIIIGARLGKRLPSAHFRTLILWVLVGLGIKVGWQGVIGLG
ncbi:sulfite exporter TauE/SafE family protein [Moraxella oblonga]|uniref:sulfite exporter TauE/SafE family protein n=1 Tax=Moraxella oblonga TaxID=200413 RepID=UPI0008320DBB|nr:sulfite exporter TauE/SafE family protein [Moraxella oblonga]